MVGEEDLVRDKGRQWQPPPEKTDMKPWGILIFTLIGATATTLAVGWSQSARNGSRDGSFRTAFQEEARRRYNRRMQEKYEDEMERVERIRRMQNVFNRERNKFRRGYEGWRENDPRAYQYHQQFRRDDWYWKTEASYKNQRSSYKEPPRQSRVYPLSHHYSILGLDSHR